MEGYDVSAIETGLAPEPFWCVGLSALALFVRAPVLCTSFMKVNHRHHPQECHRINTLLCRMKLQTFRDDR